MAEVARSLLLDTGLDRLTVLTLGRIASLSEVIRPNIASPDLAVDSATAAVFRIVDPVRMADMTYTARLF
jgi:hypothetical protein